jgi:hypothetical protein
MDVQHVRDVKEYGCLNSRIAKGILSPYYRIRTLVFLSEHEPHCYLLGIVSTITRPKNIPRIVLYEIAFSTSVSSFV